MANWREKKGIQEMPSKRFKVEEIIRKLREAEVEQAHGHTVPQAWKKIGVAEQMYYCWSKEYDDLRIGPG